jgi:hypothetical protein
MGTERHQTNQKRNRNHPFKTCHHFYSNQLFPFNGPFDVPHATGGERETRRRGGLGDELFRYALSASVICHVGPCRQLISTEKISPSPNTTGNPERNYQGREKIRQKASCGQNNKRNQDRDLPITHCFGLACDKGVTAFDA